jgi:4'-phosphopantetheinyl transferase EntD
MKQELESQVMREAEHARLEAMPSDVRMLGGLLVFSIKEAVYKAIYPIRRRFLDFQEVEIVSLGIAAEPHDDRFASSSAALARTFCGDFEARVLVADAAIPGLALIAGRYRIADGHIAAAVVLPPANPEYSDSPHATMGRVLEQSDRAGA